MNMSIQAMSSAELHEAISDIRARANGDEGTELVTTNQEWALDSLYFLMNLVDQLSPDCFDLTDKARKAMEVNREQA